MTLTEAIEILREHNRWRRGAEDVTMADPKELGIAIDTVVGAYDDALERTVKVDAGGFPYIGEIELYDYDADKPLAKKGDKVKVIVIPMKDGKD